MALKKYERLTLQKRVGENLRNLRIYHGFRLTDAVDMIENRITAAALSHYERGERLITLDVLIMLSVLYNTPIDTILIKHIGVNGEVYTIPHRERPEE